MRVLTCGAALAFALLAAGCAATERVPENLPPPPPAIVAAPEPPAAPPSPVSPTQPWWSSVRREAAAPPRPSPAASTIRGRVEIAEPLRYGEIGVEAQLPDGTSLWFPVGDDRTFEFQAVPAGVTKLKLIAERMYLDHWMSRWGTVEAKAGDADVVLRIPPRPFVTLRLQLAPHLKGQGWTFLVSHDELDGSRWINHETWILAAEDTLRIPWTRSPTLGRIRVSQWERGVHGEVRDIPLDGREVVLELGARRDIFGRLRARDRRALDDLTVLAVAEGRDVRRSPVGPEGHFHVVGLEDDRWRLVVVAGKVPDELTLFDVSQLRAVTSVEAKWGDQDVTIELP